MFFLGAPSMGAHMPVQVPLQAGYREQSESQLREGDRVWEGSVERNREPMNKNRKALVTKSRWLSCGGKCDEGVRPLLGRSRLLPERATALPEREVSRGRSSCKPGPLSQPEGRDRIQGTTGGRLHQPAGAQGRRGCSGPVLEESQQVEGTRPGGACLRSGQADVGLH